MKGWSTLPIRRPVGLLLLVLAVLILQAGLVSTEDVPMEGDGGNDDDDLGNIGSGMMGGSVPSEYVGGKDRPRQGAMEPYGDGDDQDTGYMDEDEVEDENIEKAYDEVLRETTLHTLITDKNFDAAMQRLQDHPEEASVLIRSTVRGRLTYSHMALHQAFQVDVPMDLNNVKTRTTMSQEQAALIAHLIEVNPRAVAYKDNFKRLPLHLALMSPVVPPTDVIKALLENDPDSVKVRGDEKRVALHFAAAFPMTSYENAKVVMDAFPSAVEIQDDDESLPLHLASWGGNFDDSYLFIKMLYEENPDLLSVPDGDGETPLSLMAKYGRTSSEAAGYLLGIDKKAAMQSRDELEGNTLLHHVVASSHEYNSTLYQPFLGTHPGLAQVANRVRKLPLHSALWKCCTAPKMVLDLVGTFPRACLKTDADGMLPLHHACNAGVSDFSIVEKLLEYNKGAAKARVVKDSDKDKGNGALGRLPLHLALSNPTKAGKRFEVMNEVIEKLLELYPEAAKIVDPVSKLWPLQEALITKRSHGVIKKLLSLSPEAVPVSFEFTDGFGQTVEGTALHVFVLLSQTYMAADEISDLLEDMLEIDSMGVKRPDSKGRSPVHTIWTQPEEHDDKKLLLAESLIRAYPETTHTLDGDGKTPLSYACYSRHVEGVELVLEEFPVAIYIENKHGQHPLHQLCDLGAKGVHTEKLKKIMSILLEKNPESAAHQDDQGHFPLHILSKTAGIERFDRETIEMLVDAHPEAAHHPDHHGELPLNLAVSASIDRDDEDEAEFWIALYDELIRVAPGAIHEGPEGSTPFAYALRHVDTISHRRHHHRDHVLYLVQRLYQEDGSLVEAMDGQGRNALHNLAELMGDMGGAVDNGWTVLTTTILREHPHLATQVDQSERTPFAVFVYYLCETAIGRRDDRHPESAETSSVLEEITEKLIVAFPKALEMKDQYDHTPFDMAVHDRIKAASGIAIFKRNPVMRMLRQRLRRGTAYWELVASFQKALQEYQDNEIGCDTLTSTLEFKLKAAKEMVRELDFEMAPLLDDDSCPSEYTKMCSFCLEGRSLMRKVEQNLELYSWSSDEDSAEQDLKLR